MRRSGCVTLPLIWVLLGFFIISSEAGTKWQKSEDKKPDKLSCYKCNSLYDARCDDPFDPYTLGSVECTTRPTPEHLNSTIKSSFCRKTMQKVQGKTRIIRGCGYVPDERECFTRTGTHEVTITYCSCNSTLCNAAMPSYPSVSTLVTIITFLVIAF